MSAYTPIISKYRHNGFEFNVFLSFDEKLDLHNDMRHALRLYRNYLVKETHKIRNNTREFTGIARSLIENDSLDKENLERYIEKILFYANALPQEIAGYIPETQQHLFFGRPNGSYTMELRLHHRYGPLGNGLSEGISFEDLKGLELAERKNYTTDTCMYISSSESGPNHLVLMVDLAYFLDSMLHRMFFEERSREYSNPVTDFKYDMTHELGHLMRLSHLKRLYKKEDRFEKLHYANKHRGFFIEDTIDTLIEEGIANFSIYNLDPFHYSPAVTERFAKKLGRLLNVSDPYYYQSRYLSVDTWEDDFAGVYYVGEAACYFLGFKLGLEKGKQLVQIKESSNSDVQIDPSKLATYLVSRDEMKNDASWKKRNNYLLFTMDRSSYIEVYNHIRDMNASDFLKELYSAEDMLALAPRHHVLNKDLVSHLISSGRRVPLFVL